MFKHFIAEELLSFSKRHNIGNQTMAAMLSMNENMYISIINCERDIGSTSLLLFQNQLKNRGELNEYMQRFKALAESVGLKAIKM